MIRERPRGEEAAASAAGGAAPRGHKEDDVQGQSEPGEPRRAVSCKEQRERGGGRA